MASVFRQSELMDFVPTTMMLIFCFQYDPEGFGEIPWPDLVDALTQPEFVQRIGAGKRDILLEKARTATTAAITFQDFVNVVSEFWFLFPWNIFNIYSAYLIKILYIQ